MSLKQAYEDFVQAIREETGAEPVMNIYFHTTRNNLSPISALEVIEKMQLAMSFSEPARRADMGSDHWYCLCGLNGAATVFFDVLDVDEQEVAHD